MLADGPHLQWVEVEEVEEEMVVTGRNPRTGQGRQCSWSGRVASEREGGAGERAKEFGQG